jgi:hypothetical protein
MTAGITLLMELKLQTFQIEAHNLCHPFESLTAQIMPLFILLIYCSVVYLGVHFELRNLRLL